MYLWTSRLTDTPQGRAGMDGRAGSGGSVKAARRNTGFWPKDILSPTETAYRLLTAYKRGPLSDSPVFIPVHLQDETQTPPLLPGK